MFDYIKGTLTDKNYPYCTVEANSIGYLLFVNQRTIETIGQINSEIKVYTKLIHKEDSMTLCGFKNKQDRIIFDILTAVSGVGLKAAYALLDEFETNELTCAIVNEDAKAIARTKGIGLKMAQKIVLEIKDKLLKTQISANLIKAKTNDSKIDTATIEQAKVVLESLGYSQSEYTNAIETALKELKKDDAQELVKEALKILSIF